MRYQINRILFYLLIGAAICFTSIHQARGARLAGENEITPAAPQNSGNTVVTPAPGYPGELQDPGRPSNVKGNAEGDRIPPAGKDVPKKNNDEPRHVTIDFDNVDITLFIKFISELTNKNFVIDNNVKGKVTIISPKKITVDEAYRVFESVLEVHGFTTVEAGSIIKIIPAIEARSKDIATLLRHEATTPEDNVVTQLIPLKYADPEEIKKLFGPFISKNSVMVSYQPTGMLIVTDVMSNISRLLNILEQIDVAGTGEEISVIPLEHASSDLISKTLNAIFVTGGRKAAKGAQEISELKIVPDERTNALIVLASEVDTLKIRQLIDLLDKETPRGAGDIHVYYLQNANAEDLSKVLTSIPSKQQGAGQQGTAPLISNEVQIIADKATNSLIITAKKADYLILEDVIKKLDIPRRMVYIEALIMEVSMNKQFELGAQWYTGEQVGSSNSREIAAFGSSNPGTSNFPSFSENNINFPDGLTLGVLGGKIKIGDLEFNSLGAVIKALKTDSDVQILSTPQIMTTDNEEAEIKVADNIPFLTRQDTTDSGGINYSNYEFKDVGVKLNITPQINQERFVRLKISQEVSQVINQENLGLPTTLKREAKTTVVIKDGQTIVIGGLIDETDNKTNYKVPILGDIPLLGMLFRSRSESLDKKNLYIFLTPHIIENPVEAQDLYEDKKGHIDTIQDGVIKMYEGRRQTEDMRLAGLGYKYLEKRNYEKAMDYYEKALVINPRNPYALLNIGFIHETRGEEEKAAEMYERLIELDPHERAFFSTDPSKAGRKLSDMAKDNLKNLKDH